MKTPTYKIIRGKGKPRLMIIKATKLYTSSGGTTFTPTLVQEAEGNTINITSSSASTDQILTASAHGFSSGDWVRIAGHTSTPDINGTHQVSVIDTTHVLIGIDITVNGSGGTIRKCPAFIDRAKLNQRLISKYNVSDLQYECHAKITEITDYQTLVIDEWHGGIPTNGQTLYIDGWIADLPRTNRLVETLSPITLLHNLYPWRKDIKHYGFNYECLLDFSQYVSGDTLNLLHEHFAIGEGDRLILVPRIDEYNFQYNVGLANPFDLQIIGDGEGYSGFSLRLFGTELIHNLGVISGYGYGYGENYGIQL